MNQVAIRVNGKVRKAHLEPRTLGVGYDNISDIISNKLLVAAVAGLALWKFISWSSSTKRRELTSTGSRVPSAQTTVTAISRTKPCIRSNGE